ncbi:MAG: divergent polysaccharide deacetylase family protein [Deltaproteobacteria bacterium]|nr:divergent polysaccharide deacetylase family protein [Deltaproteobacteria bacterium]
MANAKAKKTQRQKKKPRNNKPPKRKAARKRATATSQLLRIIAGLAILTLFVVAAGVLLHYLLQRGNPPLGVTPQIDSQTTRPFEIYPSVDHPPKKTVTSAPPVHPELPRVAIIIDDVGYDRKVAAKFIRLDKAFTISILPQSPFTKRIAKDARKNGLEIMLHQPMEPNEYPRVNPGPGVLLTSMSPDEIIEQLNANLNAVPGVIGVNNHMGSKMTSDAPQMRQIFSVLKRRKLFFIDSRTTGDSKCRLSASLLQVPFAERDVFIDHRQNSAFIHKQLKELVRIAKKHGTAIGIAHPHASTYDVLQEVLPEMKKEVEIVPVSRLVKTVS